MARSFKGWSAAVAAGAVAASLAPGAALADPAATATAKVSLKLVADKLNGPRGITVLKDGTVLVAESGYGGSGPCVGAGEARQCFGLSGSVYRVKGSRKGRVATRLPSLGEAGPVDVAVDGKDLVVLSGFGGSTADRKRFGKAAARLGTLYRVRNGKIRGGAVGDAVDHETRLDPDWILPREPGGEPSVNGNPWRFVPVRDHGALIADAGGNDVVGARAGHTTTQAVFPYSGGQVPKQAKAAAASAQARRVLRAVAGPAGLKAGEAGNVQSVPSGIVKGPDGAYYVSELAGFVPGASRIWKIRPGYRPQLVVSGLSTIIDIAFDAKGRLLALQMMKGAPPQGPDDPPPPGALIRIDLKTKKQTELASQGLMMPTGLGTGPHGEIYVSNLGMGKGAGQLLRVLGA
ncbi:ScyD/ScyE family protein [Actinomadura macrotermitis]|uniref:ScyD/ScyE family protein n=1 Tax=Actinomadura macrotermitis TaxID=2585200 RepID=A0A7K0BXS2_9ACTN|nr:ScyD/ScyE family protein [Actinomadura macrotermitis]MQY05969.1 hypothetical protein [Actinomadura macrotermitis]